MGKGPPVIFTFVVMWAVVWEASGSDFCKLALSWKHHRLWVWPILLHVERPMTKRNVYSQWWWLGSWHVADMNMSLLLKQCWWDFSVFTAWHYLWEMSRQFPGQGCHQLNVKGHKLGQCASWGDYFWPPARLLKPLKASEREKHSRS